MEVFESINCVCLHNVNQLILAAKAVHTNTRGVDDGRLQIVCIHGLFKQVPKIRLLSSLVLNKWQSCHFMLSKTEHTLNDWRVDYLVDLITKIAQDICSPASSCVNEYHVNHSTGDSPICLCWIYMYEWAVQNTERTYEMKHKDNKIIKQLNKINGSKQRSHKHIAHMLFVHTCISAYYVYKGKKVEEKETTQLKLLEGEGRANPWLSTLLSLQTSEPFANAPLHFYLALPFHWHTKMLWFPPESVTDRLQVAAQ